MQHFNIRTDISPGSEGAIQAFLDTQQLVSVFQFPQYATALHAGMSCFFVSGDNEDGINFFALVTAGGRKYYNIQFGPVASDQRVLSAGIQFIRKHFRYKALCLTMQLPCLYDTAEKAALFQYLRGRYFNDRYNWSTLILPVSTSVEEQFLQFSKNHQRSIRKAEKCGIQVRMITDTAAAGRFAEIYIKMYHHRGLYVNEDALSRTVSILQERFAASGYADGAIWAIYLNDVPAGGIIVTTTGNTAFYYMGATDPEQRSLPLLHIAFATVIDDCRSKGIRYFDFGGFAQHADAGSQEEKINHFKKQFGGQVMAYMPRLYFDLVPGGTTILRFLRKLKNK